MKHRTYDQVVTKCKQEGFVILDESNGLNWVKMIKVEHDRQRIKLLQWNQSDEEINFVSLDFGDVYLLFDEVNGRVE